MNHGLDIILVITVLIYHLIKLIDFTNDVFCPRVVYRKNYLEKKLLCNKRPMMKKEQTARQFDKIALATLLAVAVVVNIAMVLTFSVIM